MNRLLMTNWLRGIVVGTILVAVTSPLFVRSYLPREIDPIRGVAVMPAGATYRWRFEGYADSHIGPLGMVGKTDISEPTSNTVRIALWGDSQAEGVCVPDRDKLFKQLERRYAPRVEVFPLARSGDNVADWVAQIPAVESALEIDLHLVLIAELSDLIFPEQPPAARLPWPPLTQLPDFLIHAGRNLLTTDGGTRPRSLRFTLGPVADQTRPATVAPAADEVADWRRSLIKLKQSAVVPVVILYALPAPQIYDGEIWFEDGAADRFTVMAQQAESLGIRVLNLHPDFCHAVRQGVWPHGFHNGQFGRGHLNSAGYALIAAAVERTIGQFDQDGGMTGAE